MNVSDPTGPRSPHSVEEHPAVNRVRDQLRLLGSPAADRITILDEHARTAASAAAALGISVAQIANSLIFALAQDSPDLEQTHPGQADITAGRQSVLIMASGSHRVDLDQVADQLGIPELERADAQFVRDQTGFAIGGVAPVGHHHRPRFTVVDSTLSRHSEIWAAAGHPRAVFPTTYSELLRITAGVSMNLARP